MRWRWRIGELAGVAVYMHFTFLLLLGWVAVSSFMAGLGLGGALGGVLVVVLVFACVVAHEYGHALVARRYGIRTLDITLLPIGGVARLERMPRDPAQELRVAAAGPLVNVVIASVLFLIIRALQRPVALSQADVMGGDILLSLLWVNVTMIAFNLLPAFPMDGGRVLRALLARRMEYARATRTAASVGQIMALLFGVLGLLFNPFLVFIALFVYFGAEAEAQAALTQAGLRGVPVREVMVTRFVTLGDDEPLSRAVELLLSGSQQDFPVLSDGRVAGLLGRRELVSALQARGAGTAVRGAMRVDVPAVEAGALLEDVFQRMQTGELTALPVTESQRLVGMITMENIAEFLMIRTALSGTAKAWSGADGDRTPQRR